MVTALGMEIFCECGKSPHWFGISIRGHGDVDFRGANIDSGCIGPQNRHFVCAFGRPHLSLLGSGHTTLSSIDVAEAAARAVQKGTFLNGITIVSVETLASPLLGAQIGR